MTRTQMAGVFERRRDAWNRHDAAGLTVDYAENGTLTSPYAGCVIGHAAIETVYRSLFTAFPDLQCENESLVVEGDQVAQFFSITGTHSGEFMGMPATGRRFECHMASLYTIGDDRIRSETRVYDFSGLLIQVGVLKAKPA